MKKVIASIRRIIRIALGKPVAKRAELRIIRGVARPRSVGGGRVPSHIWEAAPKA